MDIAFSTFSRNTDNPVIKKSNKISRDDNPFHVLYPYIKLYRRGQNFTTRRNKIMSDEYAISPTRKSVALMNYLANLASRLKDMPELVMESGLILKSLTNSTGMHLFFVDKETNQLYQYQRNVTYAKCRVNLSLTDDCVAAYVARKKEYVIVDDTSTDERFKYTVTAKNNIKHILCVPIVTNQECYAVLEFYRDSSEKQYTKKDLKMAILTSGWVGLAIYQNTEGVILHNRQEVNDTILQLVLAYYGNTYTLENVLGEIINYTKTQINAERGACYVILKDNVSKEILADAYEEGIGDQNRLVIKKKLKVKIEKEESVVSTVIATGKPLNLKDVYSDPKYSSEIILDNDMMVIKRTELCVPIKSHNNILGVLTMINKNGGTYFTDSDEELMKIINNYVAMIIHYSNTLEIAHKSDLKLQQVTELLKYHLKPCKKEVEEMNKEFVRPINLRDFSWYVIPEEVYLIPRLYVSMVKDIIPLEYINVDELNHFTISVIQSYHDISYHNSEHAFNVSHSMYCILNRNLEKFSLITKQSFIVATICHDVDHCGVTNNFLMITNHLLSKLYEESLWENHHVFVTKHILSIYNIFNNLNSTNYSEFINGVEINILDTDLVRYFRARAKLVPIIKEGMFELTNPYHLTLASKIMMTACDLSGQCKPFSISKRLNDHLYEEFYKQGDLEKKMDVIPLSIMDREYQHLVPDDQVQFLVIVVLPCLNILKTIFPNTADMYDNCLLLRDIWKRIIETRGCKLWRQSDSILSSVTK